MADKETKTAVQADKPAKAAKEKSAKKSKGFVNGVKNFFKRIAKYFRDVKSEMKKVVWPSKSQVVNNTIVVLVVVAVASLVVLGLDSLFGMLFKLAIGG